MLSDSNKFIAVFPWGQPLCTTSWKASHLLLFSLSKAFEKCMEAGMQKHTLRLSATKTCSLSRTNHHSRTCPFPNWEFFYEKGDFVCMCFRGILSVHGASIHDISNARGDKRGTRSSSWGKRPLTPINPPLPSTSSPVCWGYVRNVLGSIVPLVLCFW